MDKSYKALCTKLLDTGKRNKLINFSYTMRSGEIILPSCEDVYHKLSDKQVLQIMDIDKSLNDLRNELKKDVLTKKEVFDYYQDDLKKNQILIYNERYTVNNLLNNIRKVTKKIYDDQGINVLYVALGFLNWKDKKKNEELKSPLLLIPVKIDLIKNKYSLEELDDDAETNPTLIYKLKNEYNFDLPIFKDTSSTDFTILEESVMAYFKRVELALSKSKFSVDYSVCLGTFSFLKINMYEDLMEHEEEVQNSPLVKKLLGRVVDENDVNNIVINNETELKIHNVVDADSSQMEAILKSTSGENLVIQGPPGTGKSQTITNIIAENLLLGKKILFVSEKLAALKVVYNNLNKVGLAKYCLELHSNKSNKKAVLNELKEVLEAPKESVNQKAYKVLEEIKIHKDYLDAYADNLNKKIQPINYTVYELINKIKQYEDHNKINYVIRNITSKDQNYFTRAFKAIEKFVSYQDSIGYDYRLNTWYGLKLKSLSYEEKTNLLDNIKTLYTYIDKLNIYIELLNEDLKLKILDFTKIERYLNFIKAFVNLSVISKNLFNKEHLKDIISLIRNYNNAKEAYDEAYKRIGDVYRLEIYENDFNALTKEFSEHYATKLRFLKKNYRLRKKQLMSYQKNPKQKIDYASLVNLLNDGKKKQNLQIELDKLKQKIAEEIEIELKANFNYKKLETELSNLYEAFPTNYQYLASKNNDNLTEIRNRCIEFINFYNDTKKERDSKDYLIKVFDEKQFDIAHMELGSLFDRLEKCIADFDLVENYVNFNKLYDELIVYDLVDYINRGINYNIDKVDFTLNFAYLFYLQWTTHVLNNNKVLKDVSRINLDEEVKEFKKDDTLKINASIALVTSYLSNNLPQTQTAVRGSQLSDIIKEMSKKTKIKPLRLLLRDDFKVIQEIKPCFLMSPLSVSTYLTSDNSNFDLVIFDEASQVFPEDAIGSIYRSKQVIIVGDSKQMPPTDFFISTYEDDEYDEDGTDLTGGFESILDIANASFNSCYLNWHYRSRAESLIEFSNKEFYNNRLITFPENNPHKEGFGNKLIYMENGIFDRKRRINEIEADKVVELVFETIKKYPDRTLGVVAFSISQADLIEEKINKLNLNKKNELLDKANFFIKNLETVQGDERDVIIFSLAYGRDTNGRFLNNFGPLNKEGGERRLNVAVTRAKCQNIIVTSMKSSMISSEVMHGAKSLRDYLAYLENDYVIDNKETSVEKEYDYLIADIKNVLVEKGYTVDTNIGRSNFKIDLAVKDKDEYLLAIELDGPNYYNSKTTSERNRLREQVLKNYGWSYYRIWSIDWFKNKEIEKKKLLQFIAKIASGKGLKDTNQEIDKDEFINVDKKEVHNLFTDFEDLQEIVFDKYVPYKVDPNGLVMNELFNLIDKEGPITFDLIAKKCLELFRRRVADEEYKKLLRIYLRKNPDRIFKVEDYYITDKDKEIKMRIPRKEKEERDISLISNAEIASGMYILIKNNVSISKENLYLAIAKQLGYQRVGSNIETRLNEVVEYMKEKNQINDNDDYLSIK